MKIFFNTLLRFTKSYMKGLRDPEFRAMASLVILLLVFGTVFYHQVEGWTWIDSFYFCVISLTTVGFGDLSPSTPASKLVTVFYIMMGIGILLIFVERLALYTVRRREAWIASEVLMESNPGGDHHISRGNMDS